MKRVAGLFLARAALLPAAASAQQADSFYKGKTVTLIVGFTTGHRIWSFDHGVVARQVER